MKYLIMVLFILSFLPDSIDARNEEPVPIEIVDYTEDIVGNRLVYHVRENIRKSEGFYLAGSTENRLILHINSIDPYEGDIEQQGYMTAYSILYTMGYANDEYCQCYITSSISCCGGGRVEEAAELIMVSAEGATGSYWRLVYEWYKSKYEKYGIDSTNASDSV